jgi:hypothetical protein
MSRKERKIRKTAVVSQSVEDARIARQLRKATKVDQTFPCVPLAVLKIDDQGSRAGGGSNAPIWQLWNAEPTVQKDASKSLLCVSASLPESCVLYGVCSGGEASGNAGIAGGTGDTVEFTLRFMRTISPST